MKRGHSVNGQGLNPTKAPSCAIFYVDSPEFLDLELAPAIGSHVKETSLNYYSGQSRPRISETQQHHIDERRLGAKVRSAPKQPRYQKGIQLFSSRWFRPANSANILSHPVLWILKRISWRKNDPIGQGAPSAFGNCRVHSSERHTVSKCVGDSCKTDCRPESAAAVRATRISDDKIQEHIAANTADQA